MPLGSLLLIITVCCLSKKRYICTDKSGYDKCYEKIKEGKAVKEGDGRVPSMQEVREGLSEEQGDLQE